MAVPKRKVSKSRRNKRRSHHAIKPVNIAFDSTTGEAKLPHHISLEDGYYKGRQIFEEPAEATTEAVEKASSTAKSPKEEAPKEEASKDDSQDQENKEDKDTSSS